MCEIHFQYVLLSVFVLKKEGVNNLLFDIQYWNSKAHF